MSRDIISRLLLQFVVFSPQNEAIKKTTQEFLRHWFPSAENPFKVSQFKALKYLERERIFKYEKTCIDVFDACGWEIVLFWGVCDFAKATGFLSFLLASIILFFAWWLAQNPLHKLPPSFYRWASLATLIGILWW